MTKNDIYEQIVTQFNILVGKSEKGGGWDKKINNSIQKSICSGSRKTEIIMKKLKKSLLEWLLIGYIVVGAAVLLALLTLIIKGTLAWYGSFKG